MPAAKQTTYDVWQNNVNPVWWRDAGLRKMATHVVILYFVVFTFGYDGALLNGLQITPQWPEYFDYPAGQDLGLITASYYFPKILLPPISAYISDRWGRRVAIAIGCIVTGAGCLLGAFARNRADFIGGRVLVGGGQAFHQSTAPALIQEIAHPKYRARVGTMYLGCFFVGSILSAFLTLGMINWQSEWSWRLPTLLQVLGTLVLTVYLCLGRMPESPRWQVRNGQRHKALRTLAGLHANGDENDELVRGEMAEIDEALERDAGAATVSYLTFFKTKGNRRRLMVTMVIAAGAQLGGNTLTSYYLAPILKSIGITKPAEQAGINAGLNVWALICVMVTAQFVDKIGRRPLWLQGLIGMFITFSFITGLSAGFAQTGSVAIGKAVIPFLYLFQMTNVTSFTTLAYFYATEINPYALRSKALGIYVTTQGIALSFNQYVNPIALKAIAWKYYFVFSGIQIFLIVFAYFFFVETKGYTIEEVSRVFDGEEYAQEASAHGIENVVGEKDKHDIEHEEIERVR